MRRTLMTKPEYSLVIIPLVTLVLLTPARVAAQWDVVSVAGQNNEAATVIARTVNEGGYMLEIYRDAGDAIRARITLPGDLLALAPKSCPTYQIDKGAPRNRSINDAPCISRQGWAEFILGYANNGVVESSALRGMMLGINITFRFILANGDYRETMFSLAGSMRAMQTAFGQNLTVRETSQ